MKLNFLPLVFTCLVLFCSFQTTHAAVVNITTSTNWNAITGGSGAGGRPSLGDDVVISNGAAVSIDISASCNNLLISDGTLNVGGFNLTVSGELYIQNGVVNWQSTSGTKSINDVRIDPLGQWIDLVAESFTISGDFISNGSYTPSSGTYTFSGTAAVINTIPGTVFNKVSVSGSVTNLGDMQINTSLAGAGTFIAGSSSILTIASANTVTNFDPSAFDNLVRYTSAGSQTVRSASYYNLSIENAGTSTLGGPISVGFNLDILGGTLSCGVHQITGSASGIFTMAANTSLRLGSTSSATSVLFPTGFTTSNITLDASSTIAYEANGNQVVSDVPAAYGNLTVRSGGSAAVKTYPGAALTLNGSLSLSGLTMTFNLGTTDLTVLGNITGTSGGTISFSSGNLFIAGNYTHTGTLVAGTGTVTYNGSNQTVKGATYNNLTAAGTGIKILGGSTTVNSTFLIGVGTILNSSSRNLTINGPALIDGTYTDDNLTGTNIFVGLVTINGTFSYSVAASATFRGGINCMGNMNSNTGDFAFNTANQTIQGMMAIDATVTIASGIQVTNSGILTLNGPCNGNGISSTMINGPGAELNISSTFMNTNGTLVASAPNNTVQYLCNGSRTLFSTTYHHLIVSGSGDATLRGCAVNGDLTISGTSALSLTITSVSMTGSAAGLLSLNPNATLRLGVSTASNAITFPTGFVNANILLAPGSTVAYEANGNQIISSVPAYANLSMTTGSSNTTKTPNGTLLTQNLNVANGGGACTLLINAETLNIAENITGNGNITATTGNINIGGAWTNTGTFTSGTGTVNYNGSAAQTIAALQYFNLTSSSTGARTLPAGQTVSVANVFTTGANAYTIANSTVRFNGSSAQTMGAFGFHNLTIDNAAGLSITGIQTLAGVLTLVQGNFTTTGQSFTMLASSGSAASIAAIPAGSSVIGNVTLQQFAPGGKTGYALIGTPIQGAQIVNWQDDFPTSGFTGATGSAGGFVSINGYVETQTGAFVNGFTNPTNATNPIPVGDAFWVYLGTGNPNTPAITIDVTGPVNQGNFDFAPTFTSSGTPDADGWNLMGNPYPSAIDWDAAGWTRTNIENAVYIWNTDLSGGSGNYATYINGVGTNGGNRFIAHSQGFYVVANAAAPQLQCTEAIKVPNAPTFLRTTNTVEEGIRFSLNRQDKTKLDETIVRFNQEASNDFDPAFDARKPHLPAMIPAAELYTLNKDLPLSINTLKEFKGSSVIPVGFRINNAGDYYFDFTDLSGLLRSSDPSLQNADLVLIDNHLKTQTLLYNGSTYKFTSESGTIDNRFELRIGSKASESGLFAERSLNLFADQGRFYLAGTALEGMCSVQIVNTAGQVMSEKTMNLSEGTVLELSDIPAHSGVYIVRFNSVAGGVKSFRVVR